MSKTMQALDAIGTAFKVILPMGLLLLVGIQAAAQYGTSPSPLTIKPPSAIGAHK